MSDAVLREVRAIVGAWDEKRHAVCVVGFLNLKKTTTPADGYLGSGNDEERSEMRYVM